MVPTLGEPLAGGDARALGDGDAVGLAVGEEELRPSSASSTTYQPAPLGLVVDEPDDAGQRADDRRALGGHDVLALVGVAGAAGAEARVLAAERVRARRRGKTPGSVGAVRRRLRGRLRLRLLRAWPGPHDEPATCRSTRRRGRASSRADP